MTGRGEAFAQLAHRILIAEGRHALAEVAKLMGWDYHVLYARLSNRVVFSADEIGRLLIAVPDPRLVAHLLQGTRFLATERVQSDGETSDASGREAVYRASHRMIVEAADVVEAIDVALRDGRIDHREAVTLREEIEAAERALASLAAHVRQVAG